MGMRANSGLFHGTYASIYLNGSKDPNKYSERNIEVLDYIKKWMDSLKSNGHILQDK